MPMQIRQIVVSNIRFGNLEDNRRTPSHNNCLFKSYKDDRQRLNAITPEFITETYGVPP